MMAPVDVLDKLSTPHGSERHRSRLRRAQALVQQWKLSEYLLGTMRSLRHGVCTTHLAKVWRRLDADADECGCPAGGHRSGTAPERGSRERTKLWRWRKLVGAWVAKLPVRAHCDAQAMRTKTFAVVVGLV